MPRKESPVLPPDVTERLEKAPHVFGLLLDWLIDETQPNTHIIEQTLSHLIECSDCRTAFRVLLAVLKRGGDQLDEESIALFTRLDKSLQTLPISQG